MPGDQLDIDTASVFDNVDERQVEFTGAVDGETYDFAVQYSVLEALGGAAPHDDAASRFGRFVEVIKDAALSALSRGTERPIVLISESDLNQ